MSAALKLRADALCRARMFPFLMRAFAFMHPDEPPLEAAWYLKAMCHWLERADAGELPRSMIWIQPRTLKSFTVAIAFPCWLLGRNPGARIMVATYGEALSAEHAEARRRIMLSPWYQALFPGTRLAPSGNSGGKLTTTRGGAVRAVSVGGPVTGRGADVIILDDCMKADARTSEPARNEVKTWFSTTLTSRLNDKRAGVILSIQQRICEDDLPALLAEKDYVCLNLPARAECDLEVGIGPGLVHRWKRGELLDPVRFPAEVLEQERLNLGPQDYAAQYLQNPVAPGGNLLRMEQLRRFGQPIERCRFDRVIQSWDPAATALPTSDFSVCTTWGMVAGRYFLLDILRSRLEYPELKRAVIAQRARWRADHVIIEHSSNGLALVQQLAAEGPFRPVAWPPPGIKQLDKAERLLAQTGQIEEGRVWLPASLDGLDTFLSELRAFPNGKYDDQVDSMTQMLEWSFWHWRTLLEQRNAKGRLKDKVRGPRPPLPELPDWIV
ncbi:phage terminase large subunit [Novosphingobium flavum]|uniref:Phage terminase large subunit n=1 Tax=Novosphingobium flavum TaxID=1778672 RepID=A0A7X1FTP4_9SPHN|nr:phage terminase large subunit [Novosphingobium flavum]